MLNKIIIILFLIWIFIDELYYVLSIINDKISIRENIKDYSFELNIHF